MLQVFKILRLLLMKIWMPVLVSVTLTIIANSLVVNTSFSRVMHPENQAPQTKDIELVYEALAEDVVEIFKWMATPGITPAKLATNILGFRADWEGVYLSPDKPYSGLPSSYQTRYRNDLVVDQYVRGIIISIHGYKTPQGKLLVSSVSIRPLKFIGTESTWYYAFSAIRFVDYLSKGIERTERENFDMGADDGLNQTINLKQKYFKSSKFKKYMLFITSSSTGAWRLPNGESFSEERAPIIDLEIDPL
jgi:hypothetical protein